MARMTDERLAEIRNAIAYPSVGWQRLGDGEKYQMLIDCLAEIETDRASWKDVVKQFDIRFKTLECVVAELAEMGDIIERQSDREITKG